MLAKILKNAMLNFSHVTKETFKINHYFACNSKSLIYLISCKVCDKQYVGSTMV